MSLDAYLHINLKWYLLMQKLSNSKTGKYDSKNNYYIIKILLIF